RFHAGTRSAPAHAVGCGLWHRTLLAAGALDLSPPAAPGARPVARLSRGGRPAFGAAARPRLDRGRRPAPAAARRPPPGGPRDFPVPRIATQRAPTGDAGDCPRPGPQRPLRLSRQPAAGGSAELGWAVGKLPLSLP